MKRAVVYFVVLSVLGPACAGVASQPAASASVIGRVVEAELATGPADPDLTGPGEQPQTAAEDQVIIGHEAVPSFWWTRKDGPLRFS